VEPLHLTPGDIIKQQDIVLSISNKLTTKQKGKKKEKKNREKEKNIGKKAHQKKKKKIFKSVFWWLNQPWPLHRPLRIDHYGYICPILAAHGELWVDIAPFWRLKMNYGLYKLRMLTRK
jgi:hypothetical protein